MNFQAPVYVSSSDVAPGVFGIWRPVVILPAGMIRQLSAHQLATVLEHELCHIKRHDTLLAAVHKCIELLFWFHPLVWWVGARLLREREAACDEMVLAEGHEQRTYAEALLEVGRWSITARIGGASLANVAAAGGDLTRRICAIMRSAPIRPVDAMRFALLFIGITLAWLAPAVTGIGSGALRAALEPAPRSFAALHLQTAPSGEQSSTRFDAANGYLVLKNISLGNLIRSAYPQAYVSGDSRLIDAAHYDIEASWHAQRDIGERATYRELLRIVLRAHSNVQLYVHQHCVMACRDSA